MQNKFLLILFCTKILFGQTVEQVKKAKELIQRSGMSEEQVREAAKYQGYTDQQIDAAIKKGKAGQGNDNQSANENKEELVQLDFGKSNEVINEKTELQPFDDGEMEIVDEAELDINSQSQPDKSKSLSYFGYDIFSRDPALFQATSVGAVDPDYLIGPWCPRSHRGG